MTPGSRKQLELDTCFLSGRGRQRGFQVTSVPVWDYSLCGKQNNARRSHWPRRSHFSSSDPMDILYYWQREVKVADGIEIANQLT